MILFEKNDKLNQALQTSRLHLARLQFAYSKITCYFPLTSEIYQTITNEELSYFDQFIFRFTKLQDTIGTKLFKSILINLGEDTQNMAFIDVVDKLEKLQIIRSADEWFQLRELRNLLTHEYPFFEQEVIDDLNLLYQRYELLLSNWNQIEFFVVHKFSYLLDAK